MKHPAGVFLAVAIACGGSLQPADIAGPDRSVPMVFRNGDVSLSGTLWLPSGEGPFTAVVLMGGNGPWTPARWYFDEIRDSFIGHGTAVVYYDRRGEGSSTGDFDRASFEELSDDAAAVVDGVLARSDVSLAGLFGHSMGGWIAGLAASRSPSVSFVITAAGPGVDPFEQTMFARENEDRAAGIPEATVAELAALRRKIVRYYIARTEESYNDAQTAFSSARTREWYPIAAAWRELQGVTARLPAPATLAALDEQNPDMLRWFRRDGRYQPSIALSKIEVPYLAIFGEADPVVPTIRSIAALEESIPQPHLLTVKTYPDANHMIMTGGALAPGYLGDMREWLTAVKANHRPR